MMCVVIRSNEVVQDLSRHTSLSIMKISLGNYIYTPVLAQVCAVGRKQHKLNIYIYIICNYMYVCMYANYICNIMWITLPYIFIMYSKTFAVKNLYKVYNVNSHGLAICCMAIGCDS